MLSELLVTAELNKNKIPSSVVQKGSRNVVLPVVKHETIQEVNIRESCVQTVLTGKYNITM
jgi:hypothetical protein